MLKESIIIIILLLFFTNAGYGQLREFSSCNAGLNFEKIPSAISKVESITAGFLTNNHFVLKQLNSGGLYFIFPSRFLNIASSFNAKGNSHLREFRYSLAAARQLTPLLRIGTSFIIKSTRIPETAYQLREVYINASAEIKITDNLNSILAANVAGRNPEWKEERDLQIVSGLGYLIGNDFRILCDLIKNGSHEFDLLAGFEWKTSNNILRFMLAGDERFLSIRFGHNFRNVKAHLSMELHSKLGPSTEMLVSKEFR